MADPVEASVYFFAHHLFDAATLTVLGQDGPRIRVHASMDGDVDFLGIDELDAWLTFAGITISLSDPPSDASAAERRLAEFTDTRGLAVAGTGRSFRFEASAPV